MCICASAVSVFVFVRMCKWKVDISDSEQVYFFRRWSCQCKLPVVRRYLKQIHLASVPSSKMETALGVFKTILGPSTSCDTFFSFNLKMLETSTTFIPKKVISDFHHSCFFPQLTWIQRLDQKVWRRHPLPGRSKVPRSKRVEKTRESLDGAIICYLEDLKTQDPKEPKESPHGAALVKIRAGDKGI